MAGHLSASRHVISGGAGHGVSTLACGPDRIAEFLDTLDPHALDLECLEKLQRPAFFVSPTGP